MNANFANYIALAQAIIAAYNELKSDGTIAQIEAGVKAASGIVTKVTTLFHTHLVAAPAAAK